LYTAIYSNIAVYEITVNGISVMRRRDDSKLNATQILKVAGVEKSKRTKILEREILTGQHEKVQGGYGKYQGTWIPFERGIDLCKQYSVYELLHPLLHFKPGSVPVDTIPTKEQAMAAKRRALKVQRQNDMSMNSLNSPFGHSMSIAGSGDNYSTPLSVNASAALTMLGRAGRSDTIGGSHQFSLGQPIPARKTASMPMGNTPIPNHYNQHQLHPMVSTPVRSPSVSKLDGENNDNSLLMIDNDDETTGIEEDNLPTHDLESASNNPLDPLSLDSISNLEQAKEAITQVFLDYNRNNLVQIFGSEEAVRSMDIDIPIDDLGHTALHWAAALARIPLVKELVRYGCDRRRSNYAGETVLIRAILVTNNYDQTTFSQLIEILYPAIPLIDKQHRTILHHIALTAGIKGRSQASRYYLVSLLEWIIKRGPKKKSGMDLGRFINEVVNVQDKNGDTALNIAARVGNKSIVQQLLEVQADPLIPNRAGLSPVDFGVIIHGNNGNTSQNLSTPRFNYSSNNQYNGQKSKDILLAISAMMESLNNNFQNEIDQKHSMIEILRTKLRESTSALKDTRKQVENFQEISKNLVSLRRKGKNLERALEEEDSRFALSSENDKSVSLPVVFEGNFDPDQPFKICENNKKADGGVALLSEFSAEDLKHKFYDIPPLPLLRARVKAYVKNRDNLLSKKLELKGRSVDLEKRFRKVISLCANVDEDKVDSLMSELLQAVESDPDEVDITRVAGFLKKVEDVPN
ncbi:apses-domain-containing protein, partial [Nadsonia fulvescens var. elongata DSM 6958]